MASSPKKYSSNYTSCAVHRGVEAKDAELADAHLDVTTSNSSQCRVESSAAPSPPGPRRALDDTASYLQVVVEKHRRARRREAAAAQTSPRVPSASSPLQRARGGAGAGPERGVFVLPHPVLLACPAGGEQLCQSLHAHNYYTRAAMLEAGGGGATDATSPAPPAPAQAHGDGPPALQKKNKTWKILDDVGGDHQYDSEPEVVEVYYFEQGAGAWLATCSGAAPAWVERAARRPARAARLLLREALAAPALVLRAPLALCLAASRAALVLARGAVSGALQLASDYALKPALALLYNALLQPLLVFVANVARGVRAALRPLAAALGDLAEPAARLLAAARLVDVRLACPHCDHHHHQHPRDQRDRD